MQKALLVIAFFVLAILLYLGTQNQPNPLWQEAKQLLEQDYLMYEEVPDSTEVMYNTFHGYPAEEHHDSTAHKLLRSGLPFTKEWARLNEFFQLVAKQKSIVVASINGSGATTLTLKIGELIATSPDHLMRIKCAPQYDILLHQKYIGAEKDGKWQNGVLLDFWERAHNHPKEHFVAIIDNFDKITPETFFGPELWDILDDRAKSTKIGGKEVKVPDNFYLISVTTAGLASKNEFTLDYFKRLGNQYIVQISPVELVEYLRSRKKDLEAKIAKTTDEQELRKLQDDFTALADSQNLQRFVYTFLECNKTIDEKYGYTSQLGQWNVIRKLYKPGDIPTIIQTFISHINSLKPDKTLRQKDFKDLHYTLDNNGLAPRSSKIYQGIEWLQQTGYFVEITLILATSIVTALAGWWIVRRRENILRKYGERTKKIFSDYELSNITPELAANNLKEIKDEIDSLVLARKLNYTEALYFLGFIEDKVRSIEYARETAQTFQSLYDSFYEDGIFTETEYKKIRSFLYSMRHRIPAQVFQQFLEMIEQTQNGH